MPWELIAVFAAIAIVVAAAVYAAIDRRRESSVRVSERAPDWDWPLDPKLQARRGVSHFARKS